MHNKTRKPFHFEKIQHYKGIMATQDLKCTPVPLKEAVFLSKTSKRLSTSIPRLILSKKGKEGKPTAGIEPATSSLRGCHSTVELCRRNPSKQKTRCRVCVISCLCVYFLFVLLFFFFFGVCKYMDRWKPKEHKTTIKSLRSRRNGRRRRKRTSRASSRNSLLHRSRLATLTLSNMYILMLNCVPSILPEIDFASKPKARDVSKRNSMFAYCNCPILMHVIVTDQGFCMKRSATQLLHRFNASKKNILNKTQKHRRSQWRSQWKSQKRETREGRWIRGERGERGERENRKLRQKK